jgi:hypothetical protein
MRSYIIFLILYEMNESLDLKLAINGRLFGANKKKKT